MLMPVSALPGAYGIGCFSKEAYEFVDILKEAGQKLWQILPLGQTGYGDSPYQSFSTFAGNPYFIDLETLIEDELLVLVGDGLVVLHGFGVDAIFVLSGERLLTFELLERACRSVAYGAFRGRLGAFVDVTAYAADPFGFHIHYPFTLWFLRRCRRSLYIFTAVFICVHGLEIFGAVFANWADEIGRKVFAFVDITANRATISPALAAVRDALATAPVFLVTLR